MIKKEVLIEAVEEVIRSVGTIQMSYYRRSFSLKRKPDGSIATQVDTESELYLIGHLKKIMPQACFFAEESGKSGNQNDYCWVIDPLDGTTNFVHGIPHFSISVALTRLNEPIFGAIYNPVLDDYFYAYKGEGAFYNGVKMQVSDNDEQYNRVLLVGGPTQKSVHSAQVLYKISQAGSSSYSVRHLGSSALDIAYTACGKADAVFFEGLSWWDIAAGLVIIEESGGKATTYQGDKLTPSYQHFLAGSPKMHALLEPYMKELVDKIS